jgi:hypothetical protein
MALTKEQQALLEALVAKAAEKEPRTETGVAGVLHALIDSASGEAAHRSPEAWAALHSQAEALAPAPEPAPVPEPVQYGTEGTGLTG